MWNSEAHQAERVFRQVSNAKLSTGDANMHQTIVDAMQALADAELIFKNEDEFQREFGKKLERMTGSDGWKRRYGSGNEEQFETAALLNEKTIEVDVVGRHPDIGMVAIELKYVMGSGRSDS